MFVGRFAILFDGRAFGSQRRHPVCRDEMRLTVMFDIAQFFKLRLEKQIYDSTITRSSMILPSDGQDGLVFGKSNAVGYL